MGACPCCGKRIGPVAILLGWTDWGRFVCPNCGKGIRFSLWLLLVVVLAGLFIALERLLHQMLISRLPLWLSFAIAFVVAVLVMLSVAMAWHFHSDETDEGSQ
ncbi:MAG: hypothetical protein JSV10_08755 [Candidatus Zixiibacteriota bacterium]|nr:MAG: hypothetical protein JSV10_08755 [candidate division Zixibacteria bacterium]